MINTTIPVPLDLVRVCANSVFQFYNVPFLDQDQKQALLDAADNHRHAVFVDHSMPVKVMMYLGDAPNLDQYKKQDDILVWTPTVYSENYKSTYNTLLSPMSPNWYSLYFHHFDGQYQNITPTKDFNCFINRMDVVRQSWLYLLIRRNIFERGFVSFNMDVSRLDNYDSSVSADQVFERQFQNHMNNFSDEHHIAKSIVPYRNFDLSADLMTIVMQSRFSIVLETYFHNNNEITFTEKTFRALVLPRPWLLFCSKHAVTTLRNWGFDLLDDLVDHSRYDNIDHEIHRQSIILDLAQEMLDFDVVKHQARLLQAAAHNLNLIKQWRQDLHAVAAEDTKNLLDKVHDLYRAN